MLTLSPGFQVKADLNAQCFEVMLPDAVFGKMSWLEILSLKQTNKQKTTNTKLSLGYLYGNMLI